jgi:hypothetical protein
MFENADHQDIALVGIYKLFIPDWENIKQVEGFPTVGQELWKYICQLFIDFDQQHHPEVFKGGIWLNHGFSSDGNLAPGKSVWPVQIHLFLNQNMKPQKPSAGRLSGWWLFISNFIKPN